eukprot:m.12923 g.12923  ORF g.12923 m.12923 type:complete len:155 (+) comp7092_c0_seq1:341-805(+)
MADGQLPAFREIAAMNPNEFMQLMQTRFCDDFEKTFTITNNGTIAINQITRPLIADFMQRYRAWIDLIAGVQLPQQIEFRPQTNDELRVAGIDISKDLQGKNQAHNHTLAIRCFAVAFTAYVRYVQVLRRQMPEVFHLAELQGPDNLEPVDDDA